MVGLVVMTGGASGVGLHAAMRIRDKCDPLVLAVHRSSAPARSVSVPIDLTNLDDVRQFPARLSEQVGSTPIDVLVLNAGGNYVGQRSVEGYEMTFCANHLAHYLLLRLLMPRLAQGARVIVTTSGTHDPETRALVPAPHHGDAVKLAFPEQDPLLDADKVVASERAYSASKLANIMVANALFQSQFAAKQNLSTVAFSPGPTTGTGLMRGRSPLMNFAWRYCGPLLRIRLPHLNRPEVSGKFFAEIILGEIMPPAGRFYALVDRERLIFPEPSQLARDEAAVQAMWNDSAVLVGLQ